MSLYRLSPFRTRLFSPSFFSKRFFTEEYEIHLNLPSIPRSRSIIIQPLLQRGTITPQNLTPRVYASLQADEAIGLAEALYFQVISSEIVTLKKISASHYIGAGKVQELANYLEAEEIDAVFFNTRLSVVQQRNLERDLGKKVVDRFTAILEIFFSRAQTSEAKLQVELASLAYKKSRLVRGGNETFAESIGGTSTEIVSSKQRGGLGKLAGGGEQELELERRRIKDDEFKLRKEIEKVRTTRELHRKNRQKNGVPLVAVVGYTNAGKSLLVEVLSNSQMDVEDQIFATLDTKNRKLILPNREAVVSDTVGFISELPHFLVDAFQSTLEETLYADVVVHVRDIANPLSDFQNHTVYQVLKDILSRSKHKTLPPILEVWNKIDKLDTDELMKRFEEANNRNKTVKLPKTIDPDEFPEEGVERNSSLGIYGVVPISALHNTNIDLLRTQIERLIQHFKPIPVRTLPKHKR